MRPYVEVHENGDMTFLHEAMGTLTDAKVYVGIPDTQTDRDDETEITNAGLLYIHTNGSELRHIPARPVIEPSIEANRAELEAGLHDVAQLTLDNKLHEAKAKLKQVGTLAANGAKRWFTDPRNGWAQNAPSTIRRKLARLTGKRRRKALKVLDSVQQHMPTYGTTALDTINTPLIETAEMRRAITHAETL